MSLAIGDEVTFYGAIDSQSVSVGDVGVIVAANSAHATLPSEFIVNGDAGDVVVDADYVHVMVFGKTLMVPDFIFNNVEGETSGSNDTQSTINGSATTGTTSPEPVSGSASGGETNQAAIVDASTTSSGESESIETNATYGLTLEDRIKFLELRVTALEIKAA